jgi:ATP-dependent RNA helicase SUPV3L1/SUV3
MRDGTVPADWFARQVALADHTDGDIDTLSTRIAHIRTWTFVANRPDWLADPEHWQGIARGVEDKLSDALHERLLHRFVDRRTSVLMRRLRENAMLETEISKTGEVLVEGHPLGRLEGFRFAADPTSSGPETKALRAAAQKALASEIDARSARLSAAGDDQFVLASDGTIRWLGDAVAKLTPGDDVLRPHVRIIADEHLTGAPRDTVQARLDLWVKAHIEKILGALNALSAAEDVTGLARGVAFQLVEALGVLERQKVADDIKGLDQAARATLRKYGVRFGNYHIYLPPLLKPAPRVLAMQLWALKHATPDVKGLDELPQLAASGRTSMPVDKDIAKSLYRTIGYRVCGERAVRVDILERLADLIRPALTWRAGAGGPKPPGAIEGGGFTITGAMTSLVGSSGEDFASILRALGYRMERKPKPPEVVESKPAADATADATTVDDASAQAAATTDEGVLQADAPASVDAAATSSDAPEVDGHVESVVSETAEAHAATVEAERAAAPEDVDSSSHQPALDAAAPTEVTSADAVSSENAASAAPTAEGAESAAEPEMIEVWRPGRFDHKPRHQGRPRSKRQGGQAPNGAAAQGEPAPTPDGTAGPDAASKEHGRPHRRRDERRFPKQGEGERPAGFRHGRGEQRGERRGKEGFRKDRDRHGGDAPRSFGPPRERRDKGPDPDSPFAKLAALKAALEGKDQP